MSKIKAHTGRWKKVAHKVVKGDKVEMTPRRKKKFLADAAKVNRQRSFI